MNSKAAPTEPTNHHWMLGDGATDAEGKYCAEAADLGVGPGRAPSGTTPDPWNRSGHRWFEKKDREGEVTHWSTVCRTPEGKAVTLIIWND